ncbi:Uncharacterised protein r2_g795 [Pycnogonum litorale]
MMKLRIFSRFFQINASNDVEFWRNIGFYFDCKSFVHKTNPLEQAKSPTVRVYRRRSEGLNFGVTSKCKKAGVSGKVVHFAVGISHGQGVVLCETYVKMNGEFFRDFVERHFQRTFETTGKAKIFLQDGDPSQNSAIARKAMHEIGVSIFQIPPRSPDLNPIENFFSIVSSLLTEESVRKKIRKESFVQLTSRIDNIMKCVPTHVIDRLIDSMPNRIEEVIARKGQKTRY